MGDDYREAFFDDHEWRYVRVAKKRIPKIKYIALYVGAPQSAICHYAAVAPDGFRTCIHSRTWLAGRGIWLSCKAKNRRNTLCISRFFNAAGRPKTRPDGCGRL